MIHRGAHLLWWTLHSFQQVPGATQAKSSRQVEQGREEPSSLQLILCPVR